MDELIGQKINMLTIISRNKEKTAHSIYYNCKCECGNTSIVRKNHILSGKIKSCGCLKNSINHNMSNTRPYSIWEQMMSRCNNSNNKKYKNYGGRGIKVCDKWLNFLGFWEDMQEGYSDDLTIDRIDVNGNYEKSNCRWATILEQAYNKTNTRWIELNGEKYCFTELCRRYNKSQKSVNKALKNGFTPEQIFIENINTNIKARYIEIDGEIIRLFEACKKHDVKFHIATNRLKKGFSPEEIFITKTAI